MTSERERADLARHDADSSAQHEEMSLLQTITPEVAAAIDLSSALEIVLRRVCERTGWELGQCVRQACPGQVAKREIGA